ncbi:hypothetical protein [Halobacillus trueperi]|uniref:Uncharacterized protein n=1 Tax=Halobacillus trueperi TaxID=156205 RepID=A0A3E0JEI0_9BACI|nr:hypothetical protein [Halobacillus trueperi]REJ11184.1 hypothetical protein DYE48_01955 [Halobacillus trueperi]
MNGKMLVFMQSVAIFGYLLSASFAMVKIQGTAVLTENFYFYIIFSQFVFVPIGFFLALPAFIKKRKMGGRWIWKKRYGLFLLFPSLYLLLFPYVIHIDSLFPDPMITNPSVGPVIQVLFGYFLLKGFEKE